MNFFKKISIQSVIQDAIQAAKRFPLVLFFSISGACILLYINGLRERADNWADVLVCCSLAVPFLFALKNLSERRKHSMLTTYLIQVVGIGLLLIYYFQHPNLEKEQDRIFYFVLNICLHLFASFSPFLVKGERNGFWQYNQHLFLRMVVSLFYTAIILIGIALALVAISELFDIHIRENWYFNTWTFLMGFLNTWIFLAGIPANFESLEKEETYPSLLNILIQYILLPLVILYVGILYTYAGKIALSGTLPKGWISYLIVSFSIAGILALLLAYPIARKEKSKWVYWFSKSYFIALIPLLILLFIAIGKRIAAYGVTEERYYVILLAGWLTYITAFSILTSFKKIKTIPVTLCLLGILSLVGPWSSFNISTQHQLHLLKNLLAKNKLLINGKIHPADSLNTISIKDKRRMSSIIEYLIEKEKLIELDRFLNMKLDTIKEKGYHYSTAYAITNYLGFQFINEWDISYENTEIPQAIDYNFALESTQLIPITGYDFQGKMYINFNYDSGDKYVGENIYYTTDTLNTPKIVFKHKEKTIAVVELEKIATILMNQTKNETHSTYVSSTLPITSMSHEIKNKDWSIKLVFNSLSFRHDIKLYNYYCEGYIFIKTP